MSGKTKLLIVLILALAAGNAGLAALNVATTRDGLLAAQRERLRSLREGFDLGVYGAETKLAEIAAFVGEADELRGILAQAPDALARNGGDPRAAEVEQLRRTLADVVGRRWTHLQFHYMLRQFGFYLPGNLTAFYRAEASHRYGDADRDPDSLIARTAASGRQRAGFAVDGMTTGLRAAVPVNIDGAVAVIEVGTAFDPILAPICPNSHCGIAVLLPQDATAARMNAQDFEAQFTDNRRIGPWLVEAGTNPAVTRALLAAEGGGVLTRTSEAPVQVGARRFAVTAFPLRDHLGKDDPSRPAAGQVLIWLNVDEAAATLEQAKTRNIAGAAVATLVISVLIYLLMRLATSKLEAEIRRRTSEVQSLLEEVSFLAERDPLTGLYNRRVFSQRLHQEIARARRSGEGFALVSIDLDYFKRINDRYGHPVGDQVLCLVGSLIRDGVRTVDVPARVGGEEFALLLPLTDAAGAVALSKRLLSALTQSPLVVGEGETLTAGFSAGVVTWRPELDEDGLLREVDRALYRAKGDGRGRVAVAETAEA